jgi:hypothetical protein
MLRVDQLAAKHHPNGMKRLAIGIVLACLSGALASAQDARGRYMFGIGRSSCATWQSSLRYRYEGEAWILGFWSGLNSFNTQDSAVGSQTDGEGVIAEVKKVCDKGPSTSLSDAVEVVYFSMAKGQYTKGP